MKRKQMEKRKKVRLASKVFLGLSVAAYVLAEGVYPGYMAVAVACEVILTLTAGRKEKRYALARMCAIGYFLLYWAFGGAVPEYLSDVALAGLLMAGAFFLVPDGYEPKEFRQRVDYSHSL